MSKNLAKITIDLGYVVDINDPDMIEHARNAFYEDVMNMVKYGELGDAIEVGEPDPSLSEEDIPSFLFDEKDVEEEVYEV
jgi:hypothetical protein